MIYFDYDDVKFYLSSYSSIVGIASILISIEFGMDMDSLELKNQYLIKNIYYIELSLIQTKPTRFLGILRTLVRKNLKIIG